jgi:hypothetical protein
LASLLKFIFALSAKSRKEIPRCLQHCRIKYDNTFIFKILTSVLKLIIIIKTIYSIRSINKPRNFLRKIFCWKQCFF